MRQVLGAFDFDVDKCGVTRTVLVDPERSGPLQVSNRPSHKPCRSLFSNTNHPQASINRIDNATNRGYLDRSNMEVGHSSLPPKIRAHFFHSSRCVQVCTAAGNLLAGNTIRSSQPDMLKLFSTHIAVGEFDPTGDVLPQLQALDARQPHPILNFWEVEGRINSLLASVTRHDDKLRAKGVVFALTRVCTHI